MAIFEIGCGGGEFEKAVPGKFAVDSPLEEGVSCELVSGKP
jgi:hypothetical protein